MVAYLNLNRNSGIAAYSTGPDYIVVRFKTGADYRYSYRRAGIAHVEQMKVLAQRGHGLNSYIKKFVNNLYD